MAPTDFIVAPTELIVARTEAILAPTEAILAPTEAIMARTESILATHRRHFRTHRSDFRIHRSHCGTHRSHFESHSGHSGTGPAKKPLKILPRQPPAGLARRAGPARPSRAGKETPKKFSLGRHRQAWPGWARSEHFAQCMKLVPCGGCGKRVAKMNLHEAGCLPLTTIDYH